VAAHNHHDDRDVGSEDRDQSKHGHRDDRDVGIDGRGATYTTVIMITVMWEKCSSKFVLLKPEIMAIYNAASPH